MDFENASIRQKEDYLEVLILGILQRYRRIMATSEICECLLAENEDVARYAKEEKVSQKTGRPYFSFKQNYNFAKKNLKIAGYITYSSGSPVTLTDKGANVRLSEFDPNRDVWLSGAKDYWDQKRKEARQRKRAKNI